MATPSNYESPQIRRLRSDLAAMERLQAESSVFRFRTTGHPAQRYVVEFHGRSLSRDRGKVGTRDHHEIEIKLGVGYPRSMPELRWLTPIYHPNISEIGLVCLGGYGTHWVPSLQLDELCTMLWDMARYHNYDIRSPYNRDAALWAANQTDLRLPDRPPSPARPPHRPGPRRGTDRPDGPRQALRGRAGLHPRHRGGPAPARPADEPRARRAGGHLPRLRKGSDRAVSTHRNHLA